MTYLVYTAWILAVVLVAGELDHLISRRLFARFGIPVPELHWAVSPFASASLPGLGQFLNGQPIKAVLIFFWLLMSLGSQALRPWQMLFLKHSGVVFPFWAIAVGDALVTALFVYWQGYLRTGRHDKQGSERTQELLDYLDRREAGKLPRR